MFNIFRTEDNLSNYEKQRNCFFNLLRVTCFSDERKVAVISPIFKKKDNLDKDKYRPVSVSAHVSAFFKKSCIIKKNDFMADKLSEQLTQLTVNRKNSCCTALFGLYVENVEDIRSSRICLQFS